MFLYTLDGRHMHADAHDMRRRSSCRRAAAAAEAHLESEEARVFQLALREDRIDARP